MASDTTTPRSERRLLLIPWDPTSEPHVQRLVRQRVACGWDDDAVEGWRALQQSGAFNLQWIVLADSDPEHEAQLQKHIEAHPQEQDALTDTASSFGGKPRALPSSQRRTFVPVGHVALGLISERNKVYGFGDAAGFYWISCFYVSRALQGSGLGRAAMDTVEEMAISEPLCAKIIGLNAIDEEGVSPEREEKYRALGMSLPAFSNQKWYERRGYRRYNRVEKLFAHVDSTGKTWSWDAVFLKKDIA